jgi:hypothetical protein
MSRRLAAACAATALLGALACQIDDSTAPARTASGVSANRFGTRHGRHDWSTLPGSKRAAPSFASNGELVTCSTRNAQADSALIGPSGGTLVVGNDRLIVPPGALQTPVMISGTIPAGQYAAIHFEPSGLQFRKPAGLVLDGAGCNVPTEGVHVDYVDDAGNVLERIDATYSNFWRTVAAPISHFSVYAIGL